MTSIPSADAKAVVRAVEAMTTQVRRIADVLTTPVVDTRRPAVVAALTAEHYRRAEARIVASPEEHCEAMADAVMRVLTTADDGATTPATTCSAQYHGPDHLPTACIRAAHHEHPFHTDEGGWNWRDDVAVYPVDPGAVRIAHWNPASGQATKERQELAGALDAFIDAQMRQAPADGGYPDQPFPAIDEDTQRTARRASLRNLHDRAFRGALTFGEARLLGQHITAEIREADDARTRADQAEELLRVANQTSNRSEAERAAAVQRADIAETELRVLRAGLRANGADPTNIQNLWAQIRLRNRQWRQEKQRVRLLETAAREVLEICGDQGSDVQDILRAALDGAEQPTTGCVPGPYDDCPNCPHDETEQTTTEEQR